MDVPIVFPLRIVRVPAEPPSHDEVEALQIRVGQRYLRTHKPRAAVRTAERAERARRAARIAELYRCGSSIAELCREFKKSRPMIYAALRTHGVALS